MNSISPSLALELQDVNISVIVDNKEIDIKEFIKG
jgi:hypothetical protein